MFFDEEFSSYRMRGGTGKQLWVGKGDLNAPNAPVGLKSLRGHQIRRARTRYDTLQLMEACWDLPLLT